MKSNVCVASLCDKLCSERNMIRHEQACIEGLNAKLEAAFSQLHKQVWICRHSQEILQKLINSNAAVSPTNCCQLVNNLCTSTFMDAYKVLKNYAAELIEVYTVISTAPHAISMFLNGCEQLKMQFSLDELCSSVFNMLYGSCFFPEDEQIFLELLDNLIQLQLVPSPDPRKVLRKGCSMFSRMYKYFSEALPITKIFFTAALHDPIMFLLSQDELFLDIDPLKSPIRIPAAERLRRFGRDENSDIYKEKMAQHRCVIVNKLVLIADRFITSIVNAMPIFPRSISILVSRMKTALTDQKLIREDEAALLCTELIFTYFICSAIINPEPLGIISDTPISHVARFNLMQIGQILQTLAIMPYEQRFPAYFNDILSRLDNGKIITAMESLLHSDASIFPVQISDSNGQELFRRRAFYGTLREINILQAFLKSPAIGEIEDSALLESLVKIVLKLPEQFYESRKAAEVDIPEQVTPSPMGLRNFVDKVQTVASRGHHRLMQTSSVSNLRSFQQRSISATQLTNEETLSTVQDFGQQSEQDNDNQIKKDVVLIFTLPDSNGLVGMQSKDEIQRSSDKEGDVNDQTTSDLVTRSEAISDAKRKLRLVLASATSLRKNTDLGETNSKQQMPTIQNGDQAATKDLPDCEADEEDDKLAGALQRLLDFLLAESINSRNSKQTAQIREVQRCLSVFDLSGIRFILKTLEKENRHTLAYIQYLQESKGTLLQMDNFLEEMNKRILGDSNLTSECLMEMMVRFNLQKKDIFLRQFVHEFQRLFVQDEKIDFVESHLNQLCAELVVDPMWRHATLENIEYARKCFERSLMANIYIYALFPNADADYYRDQVLHKSIQQLSDAITVDNAELAIPNSLHTECPWPSAQAELGIINAYKSPRDKMACITRCCETIENLIVLSSNRVTASADNILPILVFVIIKANPAGLLSNLQFIDGFYARRMQGSEAYWWTQFNSAVEFLKTLLNKFCH